MKDKINKLNIKFIGELDWMRFRDFLVLKMSECENEEQFCKLFESIIGSMFRDVKELDKARKDLRLKLLSEKEKKTIKEFTK